MSLSAAQATAIIANASEPSAAPEEYRRRTNIAYIGLPKLAEILEIPEIVPMVSAQPRQQGLKMLNGLFDTPYFLAVDPQSKEAGFDHDKMLRILKDTYLEVPPITSEDAMRVLANLSTTPVMETNFFGECPGRYASVPLPKLAGIVGDEEADVHKICAWMGGTTRFVRGFHANVPRKDQTIEVYTDRLIDYALGRDRERETGIVR